MDYPTESGQIMFLLNSGEWGEIAGDIEELKEKKRQLDEAKDTFWGLLADVEEKRLAAFKKRLSAENVGICQHHSMHAPKKMGVYDIFPANIFPIDKLKIVSGQELGTKVMCDECITKLPRFLPKYDPPRCKTEVKETPTIEQLFDALSDNQRRNLEFHFKMPHLRDFMEFHAEWLKKREAV